MAELERYDGLSRAEAIMQVREWREQGLHVTWGGQPPLVNKIGAEK